jgi:hypothetical protein
VASTSHEEDNEVVTTKRDDHTNHEKRGERVITMIGREGGEYD